MYSKMIKPFADFFGAIIALLILFPLFVVIAIAIKIDSSGPIFFIQERLGKNGKVFKIIKFRSMTSKYELEGNKKNLLQETDPRITAVGKIIRKTSIDELPQLINIIKGEMSFIGPRPPLTYYPKEIEEYTPFERKRFNVKPGISGLAQIRCREIHDWNTNIPIDVEYVENKSFTLDFKLFIASLFAFFRTDNIYTPQ